MKSSITYKDNLFERTNLIPIRGEPTFKMIHKLRNEIKENARSVYSNLGGGSHGHLVLVLTDTHYALIYPNPFVYPTHQGPFIIPDVTTAHTNSNMRIAHTEEVHLLREVKGVEKAFVKQIFGTVEEAYIADIRNRTTNLINKTVAGVLTQLQENCGQLMPHKLLEQEDIFKKTNCKPRNRIATVFSAVK